MSTVNDDLGYNESMDGYDELVDIYGHLVEDCLGTDDYPEVEPDELVDRVERTCIDIDGSLTSPMVLREGLRGDAVLRPEGDVRTIIAESIDPDRAKMPTYLKRPTYCVHPDLQVRASTAAYVEAVPKTTEERAARLRRRCASGSLYTKAPQPFIDGDAAKCMYPDKVNVNGHVCTVAPKQGLNKESRRVDDARVQRLIINGGPLLTNMYMRGGDYDLVVNDYATSVRRRRLGKDAEPVSEAKFLRGRFLHADLEYTPLRLRRTAERALQWCWFICTGTSGDEVPPIGAELLAATENLEWTWAAMERVYVDAKFREVTGVDADTVDAEFMHRFVENARAQMAELMDADEDLRRLALEIHDGCPVSTTILRTPAGLSVLVRFTKSVEDYQTFRFLEGAFVELLHMNSHVIYNGAHGIVPCMNAVMQDSPRCAGLDDPMHSLIIDKTCTNPKQLTPVPWSVRDDDDGRLVVAKPLCVGEAEDPDALLELFGHRRGALFEDPNHERALVHAFYERVKAYMAGKLPAIDEAIAQNKAAGPVSRRVHGVDDVYAHERLVMALEAYRDRVASWGTPGHLPVKWRVCMDVERVMGKGDDYCARFDRWVRAYAERERLRVRDADERLNGVDCDVAGDGLPRFAVERLDLRAAIDYGEATPQVRALHALDVKYLRTHDVGVQPFRVFATVKEAQEAIIRDVDMRRLLGVKSTKRCVSSPMYEDRHPSVSIDSRLYKGRHLKDYLYSYAPDRVCGDVLDVLRCLFAKKSHAISARKAVVIFCRLFGWAVTEEAVYGEHTGARRAGGKYVGRLGKPGNCDEWIANCWETFNKLAKDFKMVAKCAPTYLAILAATYEQCHDERCCRHGLAGGFATIATSRWLADNAERLTGMKVSHTQVDKHVRTLLAVGLLKRLFSPGEIQNTTVRRTVVRMCMEQLSMPAVYELRNLTGGAVMRRLRDNCRRIVKAFGDSATPFYDRRTQRAHGKDVVAAKCGRRIAAAVFGNLDGELDEYQQLYGRAGVKNYRMRSTTVVGADGREHIALQPSPRQAADAMRLFAHSDRRLRAAVKRIEASEEYAAEQLTLDARGRRMVFDWDDPDLVPRSVCRWLDGLADDRPDHVA